MTESIGVASAHVVGPHFSIGQIDGGLVGAGDLRWRGLVPADHVIPRILVSDALRELNVFDVSPRVVAVVVGADDLAHWLVCYFSDCFLDLSKILRKLVIDQNDALAGHADADVPTAAGDHVEALLNLLKAQRRCRLRSGYDDDGR